MAGKAIDCPKCTHHNNRHRCGLRTQEHDLLSYGANDCICTKEGRIAETPTGPRGHRPVEDIGHFETVVCPYVEPVAPVRRLKRHNVTVRKRRRELYVCVRLAQGKHGATFDELRAYVGEHIGGGVAVSTLRGDLRKLCLEGLIAPYASDGAYRLAGELVVDVG